MEATHTNAKTAVPSADRPIIMPRGFRAARGVQPRRHWVRGDAHATAFFNALSAVFPHGETFMVRSMIPWAERVPPSLGREVNAFIEQEAGHSREHIAMNKGLIGAGYDVAPLERKIKAFVRFFENTSDMTKLTATMCIEHFTAIVAAEVLKTPSHLDGSDAELRELWLWHAVEEVEHKGVAYDVWLYATKDWNPAKRYALRAVSMLAVTASFFINRSLGQIELLRQDGFSFFAALKGILRSGFGKGGVGRNVLGRWASFFRPNFHPWDHDDRLLLAAGEADLAFLAASRAGYQQSDVEQLSHDRPIAAAA
jgi:uncharacterized protein